MALRHRAKRRVFTSTFGVQGGRRSYDEDILSQCNTQLIFRMVSAEDLAAVAGCFEQASEQLLRDLPQYTPGTAYLGEADRRGSPRPASVANGGRVSTTPMSPTPASVADRPPPEPADVGIVAPPCRRDGGKRRGTSSSPF